MRFSARYPAVRVDITLTNNLVDLVAERFDVALRLSGRRLKDSSLVARQVGTLTIQLFASPQYLARRGNPRTPAELSDHAWATLRGFEKAELVGPNESVALAPKSAIRCDDMFFLCALVAGGAGIALLPNFLAEPKVATGELVRVLPRYAIPSGAVWLVIPSAKNIPAKVTAFRDFVLEALSARPLG